MLIAITHPIPDPNWELLVKDNCPTSWGDAEYYVFEKLTPAAKRVATRRNNDDELARANENDDDQGPELDF